MKAIANIKNLPILLSNENQSWKQKVFDLTGVIPNFDSKRNSMILYSNCGYIDLDIDAEYMYSNGVNNTEFCEIKSITELVDYIKNMESYKGLLIDESLGLFTKSDLFWGVWTAIISVRENMLHDDGHEEQEWNLYSIKKSPNSITLNMALIACDSIEISIDISDGTTLQETLNLVVTELNNVAKNVNDVPNLRVYLDKLQPSPDSFESLNKKLFHDGMVDLLI